MDEIAFAMEHLLTPPRGPNISQRSPAGFESPHRQAMRSTNVYMNGTLEERREAVKMDLGPTPEVSVDFMLQHLLPKSGVDVDATLAKLKANRNLTANSVWAEFVQSPHQQHIAQQTKDPDRIKKLSPGDREAEIFQKLKGIYDSIIAQAQFHDQSTDRRATLVFKQDPDRAPESDTDNRTRPDGYGVLTANQKIHSDRVRGRHSGDVDYIESPKPVTSIEPRVQWLDIACVEEYKLRDGIDDHNDNVHKILWSLHFLMDVDHRRRFCFGITVENVDMRIWLACREVVIVTQPFDFSKNPSRVIQLITSLAFAEPAELGYDPTMKLQWGGTGFCYDIQCSGKLQDGSVVTHWYRTQELLSDSSHNIRGRATRVYLVRIHERARTRAPLSLGRYYILKDSWVDIHRIKEGDTLHDLLKDATDDEKNLFLTVYQHGIVQIDGQDDRTTDLILKGQKIVLRTTDTDSDTDSDSDDSASSPPKEGENPGSSEYLATLRELLRSIERPRSEPASQAASRSKHGSGSKDALRHATHRGPINPIVYSPKDHYRIVFEEAGESMKDIIDDGKLTTKMLDQVMKEVATALQYMARKGYIHRDVSPGNIVWYNGCAKLADLDFAKQYGAKGSPFVRTGTYSYMPGEAMKGTYSTLPVYSELIRDPFVYNPIHDLEALFWVGIYCISWQYPAPFMSGNTGATLVYRAFDAKELKQIRKLQREANILFPSVYTLSDFEERMKMIHDTDWFHKILDHSTSSIRIFGRVLKLMSKCISDAYHEIQRGLPRTDASYFTAVLRIPDPLGAKNPSTGKPSVELKQLQVHEAVLQIFAHPTYMAVLDNGILWPVEEAESEKYSEFLKSNKLKGRLRSRRLPHGSLKDLD